MPRKPFVAGVIFVSCLLVVSIGIAQQQEQQAAAVPGRQYTPPGYVFDADLPHDVVTYNLGAIGMQPFVDTLAWDAFVALNWPAPQQSGQRGVPDRQNIIGGFLTGGGEGGKPKSSPAGPTVWETYKDSDDIYLNPPVKPAPFDTGESIPPSCKQAGLTSRSTARTFTMDAKVSDVLHEAEQAFTHHPLVDQNGEKVWYEVKVNRAYYDYVVNNGFYNSANQAGKTISFPSSSNTTGNEPVVKVKSAWKIMGGPASKQPDDQKRFYTTDAFIYDPETKGCSKQRVGLVGLHVVMKTATLPQWMWATFEHVDNAPTQGDATAGRKYNFYNPSCTACPINTPPPDTAPATPTQVVRLVPLPSTSTGKNTVYQAALQSLRADNVFANYMLIDAQWGGSATPPGVPNQPKYLANAVLETYLQEPEDEPSRPHGCINCHGSTSVGAAEKDLDFQLYKAFPKGKVGAAQFLGQRATSNKNKSSK